MVTMMVMTVTAQSLREILNIRQCVVLRSVLKVGSELVQLIRLGSVAIGGGGFGRALQIGRNLRGDLLILRGIRLLELLQSTQYLSEGGELVRVLRLRERGLADAARAAAIAAARNGAADERLDVRVGDDAGKRVQVHVDFIGISVTFLNPLKTLP